MEFDISGRGGGKTYRLIEWLREDQKHRRVLVHNQQAVQWVRQQYLHLPAGAVISPHDLVAGMGRGHRDEVIGIDNLDLLLPNLLGPPIERVTSTGIVIDQSQKGNPES